MTEWIRFFLVAALMLTGLFGFVSGVIGVYRFGFVMNRMHAGGIGDTFGLFLIAAALMIASVRAADALKLLLAVVFMWFTSPVSTHFLSRIEYDTNPHLDDYVERKISDGQDGTL